VPIDSCSEARRFERRVAAWSLLGVGVVVLSATLAYDRSPSTLREGRDAQRLVALVGATYDGVPQRGRRLGSSEAPVEMTVFADLQSPRTRRLMLGPLPSFVRDRTTLGQVRLRFRSMRQITPRTRVFLDQQTAALAAARQDRLWQFVALFLRQQGEPGGRYVTDAFLRGLARQAGLDVHRFTRDRHDPGLREQVRRSARLATALGASGGPLLRVTSPHGSLVARRVTERAEIEAAYDRVWHLRES
jgi:protein-disulfide isomerase